jgi:cyclic pyranopterin phosphate synthase
MNNRSESLHQIDDEEPTVLAENFSETIDLASITDERISNLIERERVIPVVVGIDRSLRPKIIDNCGLTCVFCHNEGTPVAGSYDKTTLLPLPSYKGGRVSVFEGKNGVDFIPGVMAPDEHFSSSLLRMMETTDSSELHLTGGEPTLHPELPQIVKTAKNLGYKVKMTSNGENGRHHIQACAEAGLDKINFSIFGTTPEELADVQHEKYRNTKLAQVKLNALHSSIEEAIKHGIKVDANIVMSDYSHAERVARIIDRYGDKVSVRILNDLDAGDESYLSIYKLLADLGAEPVELYVEAGTSNSRVRYRLPDGLEIFFKQIRRTTLPETCSSCSLNNDTDCSEGYYGMRLYTDTAGQYKVGVCLQRMDLTENIQDFLESDLPGEIKDHRAAELAALTSRYANRLKG